MITTRRKPRTSRGPSHSKASENRCSKSSRQHLKARTEEVLKNEVAFIPNTEFRELEESKHWRELLSTAKARDVLVTEQPKTKARMQPQFETLCSAPLLKAEEERDLFRDMNYLKYRANCLRSTLNANRPSVRKLDGIAAALQRADEIRNELVAANTRLVVSIAKKFANDANAFDDLLSDGLTSLMNAVEKFNYDRGFRFSTYATMVVRRALYRSMEKGQKTKTRFTTGHSETIDQEQHEYSVDEFSFNQVLHLNSQLEKMISRLDDRENLIVRARFGFEDLGVKATFANIGERLGISKERVRQLEMRAMNKLRDMMIEDDDAKALKSFAFRAQ